MKRSVKVFSLLICLFCSFMLVKAERLTCDEINNLGFTASSDFVKTNSLKLNFWADANASLGAPIYQFVSGGKKINAYCQEPGLYTGNAPEAIFYCIQTGRGGENEDELSVKNTNDSNLKKRYAYNSGIIAILKKGYNKNDVITQLALRIYEMIWRDFDENNPNTLLKNQCMVENNNNISYCTTNAKTYCDGNGTCSGVYNFEVILHLVGEALKNQDIANKIQKLEKNPYALNLRNSLDEVKKDHNYQTLKDVYKISFDNNHNANWATTIDLIKTGLDGAKNYLDNGVAEITLNNESDRTIQKTNDLGVIKYYHEEEYIFEAKNFNSSKAYIDLKFNCENCNNYGIDYTIKVNDQEYNNSNLKSYLTSGDGKLKVVISFVEPTKNYACEDIKYSLDLEYYDETINAEAFMMISSAALSAVDKSSFQKFSVLYNYDIDGYNNKSNNDNDDITEKISIKDSFNSFCNKLNSCKILDGKYYGIDGNPVTKAQYKKECGSNVNCSTNIGNAICTDSDSNIYITEGTEYDEGTCTNEKETNVLQCIINNKDDAENSYEAKEIVEKNNYCTVWCKEDFHLTLPGNQYVNSGRYFTLQTSITGTKTCYTSKINREQFNVDYTAASSEIKTAYRQYNNGKITKSQLNQEIMDLDNIIQEYNLCSNWDMDYQFEPEVEFWYEEAYMNNIKEKTLTTNGTNEESDTETLTLRCTSDTNDTYDYCETDNDPETDWTENNQTEKIKIYTCSKDTFVCGYKEYNISKTVRMTSSITSTRKYITPTQFYTIYPSGAIVAANAINANDIENATPLINGLPVALRTKKGAYNYTLKVDNLGEYYDSDELGRVWGDKDSVVSVTLEEQEKNDKCSTGALVDNVTINGKDFDKGVYTCGYVVNCPDCPVVCDPPCIIPDCPDGDCLIECDPPCVFDKEDINIGYKPISPDDVNPNDNRPLGPNWAFDGEVNSSLEMKAAVTTKEIEEDGEEIFDVNYSDKDKEFSMEVTMGSKMISWIRSYNDSKEDKGGYLNNSLKCYDYKNALDNQTYDNIYCYSTFIDEMIYGDFKDSIKISPNGSRVIGTTPDLTDSLRKTDTQLSGYWTTWSLATIKNSWQINTTIALETTQKNYKSNSIGPAWK